MIRLKLDKIPVTINDNFNVIVDSKYKDLILPLINIAKHKAELDYSVSNGFYSHFLADYLKELGFTILEISEPEEKEKELLVY